MKIINYGTFTAGKNNSDTSIYIMNVVDAVKGMRLVEQTDEIKGNVGVRFGYSFITTLDSNVSQAALTMVTRHPEMTNPHTGKTTTQDAFPFRVANGLPEYRGWYFGEQWEVVKGTWFFDTYYQDKLINTHKFIIH